MAHVLVEGSTKKTAEVQSEPKEVNMRPSILFTALLGTFVVVHDHQGALAQGINLDIEAIEQASGLKGQLIAEENVFKVTKPRTDVKIVVDQWTMPPFMGQGMCSRFMLPSESTSSRYQSKV